MMNVEVIASTEADKHVLLNLYVFYLYDLTEFVVGHQDVNRHGSLNGPDARTHDEAMQGFTGWWEKPGVLHPFLIRVDGQWAGFALVAGPPHVRKGRDFLMNEFFILKHYRGKGVGRQAAKAVFDLFRGKWEVSQLKTNPVSMSFWLTVIAEYTQDSFQVAMLDNGFGELCLTEHFDNTI
jgi:predicted acetyltransferase